MFTVQDIEDILSNNSSAQIIFHQQTTISKPLNTYHLVFKTNNKIWDVEYMGLKDEKHYRYYLSNNPCIYITIKPSNLVKANEISEQNLMEFLENIKGKFNV